MYLLYSACLEECMITYYTRQQLAEIIRAQNELKELAKRLQYYDDDMEEENDGSPDLQVGMNSSYLATHQSSSL